MNYSYRLHPQATEDLAIAMAGMKKCKPDWVTIKKKYSLVLFSMQSEIPKVNTGNGNKTPQTLVQ